MTDIVIETVRAIVMGLILGVLWWIGAKEQLRQQRGWLFVVSGSLLVFLGGVFDITDNFSSLNKYVIIGDTVYQAFLEKVVGYLLGYVLIFVGFLYWLPIIAAARRAELDLRDYSQNLELLVGRHSDALQGATDQLQAESADRIRAEEGLRTVVNNLPGVVFAMDIGGVIRLAEGRNLKAFIQNEGDIVGRSISDIFHPGDAFVTQARLATAGESGSAIVTVNGEVYDTRFEPIRDINGEVVGVVGVATEVTEFKRIANELSDAGQMLNAVMNSVAEGIITIDSDGIIVMLNREVQAIWGYSEEELIGQTLEFLMPEKYRDSHATGLQRYLKTGSGAVLGERLELEGLRADGSTFPMDLFVVETIIGGTLHFTGSVRDITQRKEIDRMKDEFISIASHQLRTPMTSIKGFVELLLMDGDGKAFAQDQRRFLEAVRRNTLRLERLVSDMIDVSKLDSGLVELEISDVQIRGVIDDVLVGLRDEIEKKELVVETVHSASSRLILGDPARIAQIIDILVKHAVDSSPQKGHIKICTDRTTPDGREIEVSLTDQGLALTSEESAVLFEKFRTGGPPKSAMDTGLGLPIAKALIELHGGRIRVSSPDESGNLIQFTLPTREATDNDGRARSI